MTEVKRAIEGWQRGDAVAAMWVLEELWEKLYPIMSRKFKATDGFKTEDASADTHQAEKGEKDAQRTEHVAKNADHFIDEGFWAALEEVESMLDPQETFWIEWTDETKQVEGEVKPRRIFVGRVTERKLTERAFKWRGEEQFRNFFRDMWILRSRDALSKELALHNNITTRAKSEQPSASAEGNGIRAFSPPTSGLLSLEATRDHTTVSASGAAYEDEISGLGADGPCLDLNQGSGRLTLEAAGVLELVEELAKWAEQLRLRHKRLHQTIEALLRYVKSRVAKTNPQYAASSPQHLQQVRIEELLMSSNMHCLDFDEREAWQFVQDDLGLKKETTEKRKSTLRRLIQTLGVPDSLDSLRAVPGMLWLRDMRNYVEDCRETAKRLEDKLADNADDDNADDNVVARYVAVLRMVDIFLRWTLAKGHPSYCHCIDRDRMDLQWLESVKSKDLFTSNNPYLLTPTSLEAETFRQFVTQYYPYQQGFLAEISVLRDALKKTRLSTVLEALC